MPRKPRMYFPGVPAHIVQRGNNRNACFFSDEDYLYYLEVLWQGIPILLLVISVSHVLPGGDSRNPAGCFEYYDKRPHYYFIYIEPGYESNI